MQIKIDESRCIGCGMCAAAVPEVFAIVGRVSTAVGAPEKSRESRVFDAANGCPVNAISEGDTQYQIDPDVCVECGACAEVCPVGAPAQA